MKKHIKKIHTKHNQIQEQIKVKKAQNQLLILLVAAVAVLLMFVLFFIFSRLNESTSPRRLVTFYDQGAQYSVLTRADTVQGALTAAAVEVDSHDTTDPAFDSKLDASYVDVIIYRSRPINVIDGGIRQTVMTVAQSPNEILKEAQLKPLDAKDKTTFDAGSLETNGAAILTVERAELEPELPKPVFAPGPNALTKAKGAQIFIDSSGVAHRETYYDLRMNIVIGACGANGSYTIRSDGAKIDQDGYVLVAAGLSAYPRCSIVETSMGPGKVYDTGGFALRHPYGFDLATDWTNYDGQ